MVFQLARILFQMCFPDSFPVVFDSIQPPHRPVVCHQQIESPVPSSNCLPIGSLRFEFDTVTAFGLHSWVHCVRLSGCFSLPASVPLVSRVSHSGQWLPVSGCLSSLVSLCLSPSLALDVWWCPAVRMSFLCIHLFPIMFLLPSFSGFKYLSPNSSVFNHQSASAVVADSFACLPLRVSSIVCF